jgi:hypothetical protein
MKALVAEMGEWKKLIYRATKGILKCIEIL